MRFFSLLFITALLFCAKLTASSDSSGGSSGSDISSSIGAPGKKCQRKSQNFFIPTLRVQLAPELCDWVAVSFLGEAGIRNYRANGTVGVEFDCNQRFKVGAEYLSQKLAYHFCSGKSHKWVDQWAIGGQYQYLLDCEYIQSFDVCGRYSHAWGRNLKTNSCIDQEGNLLINYRHIAGSDAWNVGAGFTLVPLCDDCTLLTLTVDYDHVRYNRHFNRHKVINGWGGTAAFTQALPCNLDFCLKGEFRRPYNYVEGSIGWDTQTCWGDVNIGIYGGHTYGKYGLPNSTVAGVTLDWAFGGGDCCYNNASSWGSSCSPCRDLASWICNCPAVYVPEVLAIVDQRCIRIPPVTPPPLVICTPPTVITDIPATLITAFPTTFQGATLFSSAVAPTFSLTTPATVSATINPATGLVTVNAITSGSGVVNVLTVTATVPGGCSASSTISVFTESAS